MPIPGAVPLPAPVPRPGPATPPSIADYYEALFELQAIDFVLVELTLYLNTHPNDTAALEQFNETTAQRKKIKHQFEARFGPLTQFQSPAGAPFSWAELPWPWEV
jgi:spore coat protein JB